MGDAGKEEEGCSEWDEKSMTMTARTKARPRPSLSFLPLCLALSLSPSPSASLPRPLPPALVSPAHRVVVLGVGQLQPAKGVKAEDAHGILRREMALAQPQVSMADVVAVEVVQGGGDLAKQVHLLVRHERAVLLVQLLRCREQRARR